MDRLANPADANVCESAIDEDLAVRYLRRELPVNERDAFELHYFACEACAALVTHLEAVLGTSQDGHVLIVTPDSFYAVALPPGPALIGRSLRADIRLDDPLLAPEHLRLIWGESPTIEDLGSASGTLVQGASIDAHKPTRVAPGEVIAIGSSTLIVQRGRWWQEPRSRLAHEQFVKLVQEECLRLEGTGERLTLLRVHLEAPVTWTRVIPLLVRNILPPHLFATCGDDDYEILLFERNADDVQRIVRALRTDLRLAQVRARFGRARYPRDGLSADALLARANAQLLPAPVQVTVPSLRVSSPAMQRVYDLAGRAAASNMDILLLGETGVGKEWVAHLVHGISPRAGKPLLSVNCAALSESLIESELFGHERGAFTGATQVKPGVLELADGGTVLLDEIGELPLVVQAKLLRVMSSRQMIPVGGLRTRHFDVRFIAATSRNLEAEIAKGTFRPDLLFRLAEVSLVIPPLRERREEISQLACLFVAEACREAGRSELIITPAAMALLEEYSWPGNIRELKNLMHRAVQVCTGTEIRPEHLPRGERLPADVDPTPLASTSTPSESEQQSDPELEERRRILDALAACAGNQSRAAQILGLPRRTLISRLEDYISRPRRTGPPRDRGEK